MAIDNGFQACLMAPTEILANQHYHGLKSWCDAVGIQIKLLTDQPKKRPYPIHNTLQDGSFYKL